jgi:hypothetical protein
MAVSTSPTYGLGGIMGQAQYYGTSTAGYCEQNITTTTYPPLSSGYYQYMKPPEPKIQPAVQKRRFNMMENVKGYVEKYKDMIFTLGLVILIDHFMFKGALRERIKTTIEGALKKVEDKFHKED